VHVVATHPADGAGTECTLNDPPECGVPRNTPIEIRFDRFLLPKTAVRQSIRLFTGPRAFVTLQPFYDTVERVVVYRVASGDWLRPGLLYQVELVSPKDDENGFGFRAFDGAPLSKENEAPLRFSFRTARATPAPIERDAPPNCFEAWSALGRSGCSKSDCHSGNDAPMNLRLDSRASLLSTAIGHVAHEADTGPVAGRPLVDPSRFGTGMPVIDPGNPGTSFLLYKLLVGPANFSDGCTTKYSVPTGFHADGGAPRTPSRGCPSPEPEEQQRLRDWFVPLEPMPLGSALAGGMETLNLLQQYILAGAETETCP
jgi:hypothetical protein